MEKAQEYVRDSSFKNMLISPLKKWISPSKIKQFPNKKESLYDVLVEIGILQLNNKSTEQYIQPRNLEKGIFSDYIDHLFKVSH